MTDTSGMNAASKRTKKIGKRAEHRGKKVTKAAKKEEKRAQRLAQKAKRLEKKARRQKSWGWRLFRFIFHLLWLPLSLVGALALGLVLGYSVLGGDPAREVFDRDLWQYLYDIIYAEG